MPFSRVTFTFTFTFTLLGILWRRRINHEKLSKNISSRCAEDVKTKIKDIGREVLTAACLVEEFCCLGQT
jgi:hypothetical protein